MSSLGSEIYFLTVRKLKAEGGNTKGAKIY